MEIRANFMLIGVFVLLALLGIMLSILWLAKLPDADAFDEYVVHFKESVSGLSIGNAVLFSGIQVGQVQDITISGTEPGSVQVLIRLRGDTPVREDSVATLEMQGLTGSSVVAITGGTRESMLVILEPGTVGTIRAGASPLKAVVSEMPEILESLNLILENIKNITSETNQQDIVRILSSTADLLDMLASEKDTIAAVLRGTQASVEEFHELLSSVNKSVQTVERTITVLDSEVRGLTKNIFPQLRALVSETRVVMRDLSRLNDQVQSDPRQFFFGTTMKEFTP